MTETVDLSGLDVRQRSQEGADMPLLDHAGRPTRVVLRVRGADSQEYGEMFKTQVRRQIERAPRKQTEAERNAEFWELNATLVCGWSADGKPAALRFGAEGPALEYSPANAARLLEDHPWIFEQVQRFSGNRTNFVPGSAAG